MTPTTPTRSSRLAGFVPVALASFVVGACLLYLGVRYLLWPNLDAWRPELFAQIERSLGAPVTAERLEPAWEGLHPSLVIGGLTVLGADGKPRLTVPSVYGRVSWRSLALGRPRLAALRVSAIDVTVERFASGEWRVAGLDFGGAGGGDPLRALDWLLAQGELSIDDATVRLIDHRVRAAPTVLSGIRVSFRNTGRHHQASLSIERPGALAGSIAIVADVTRPAFSRPADWSLWRGELHLSGDRVDLAAASRLAAGFADPLVPSLAPALAQAAPAGRLDHLGWLRFDEGRLVDGLLKARAQATQLRLPQGRLAFRDAAAEVRIARLDDGGTLLRIAGLSLVDRAGARLAGTGEQHLELDATGQPRSARVQLQAIDAAAALSLARRLPLQPGLAHRLDALRLEGTLTDASLRWDRDAGGADRVSLDAGFQGLSLAAPSAPDATAAGLPGFSNLSGRLRATESEGRITLAGRRATLVFPGVFAEPRLGFDRLEGNARWTVDAARGPGWLDVVVDRLEFANGDAAGTAAGRYRTGGKGAGVVELSGTLTRGDGSRVARYLPVQIPTHVRDWVAGSIPEGRVEQAAFELRGALADFPFRDPATGAFKVTARLADAVLDYAAGWPGIRQVRGDLVFDRASVELRADSAQVYGSRLSGVRARIDDMAEGRLEIVGRGAGPAMDMLRFVVESPLAIHVGDVARDAGIDGDAALELRLALPLANLGAAQVAGAVILGGNRMAIDRTMPALDGVAGRVEFTEQGIVLRDLRATLLGGPLRVDGRSVGAGRMKIEARGSIDADGMRRLVDNVLTRRLAGRTEYRAVVDVDRRASSLTLESDLIGLASALPAPFSKRAEVRLPLRVRSTPMRARGSADRPPGDRLDLRLGEDIAFEVERERDTASERMRVRRASFAVAAEPVLRDSGLSVLLHTGSIDFDAWREVLSGDGVAGPKKDGPLADTVAGFPLVPDVVSVVAAEVRIGGKELRDVVFGASRHDGFWRANVSAREINGYFYWLDAAPGQPIGTLSARFTRLVLPRASDADVAVESALTASPTLLPALDVAADELVIGERSLGRLSVQATNGGTDANPVWKLDRLAIANADAQLEASGRWAFAGQAAGAAPSGGRATALDFKLAVRDSGDLLARFGKADLVRGGSGVVSGKLTWDASPLAIDYGTLGGSMRLQLGKGQFLKADPGIAKLIGVLNLQSLPKRLALDFRDVFSEGFAFDEIAGDVSIARGIARADDLRMRGLQAHVNIRGVADLQHETQNLQVEVLPQLDAGLAALAYGAIVNPLLGLGSFAAQYALRRPLQQALGYEVDVTGSWADPTVSERIRRAVPQPPPASP